jgi:hypothetical protein
LSILDGILPLFEDLDWSYAAASEVIDINGQSRAIVVEMDEHSTAVNFGFQVLIQAHESGQVSPELILAAGEPV